MKFKKEDRVKLKFGGINISRRDGVYVSSIFDNSEGQIGVISEIHDYSIRVKLDKGEIWWRKESFEFVNDFAREIMLEIEKEL